MDFISEKSIKCHENQHQLGEMGSVDDLNVYIFHLNWVTCEKPFIVYGATYDLNLHRANPFYKDRDP